MKIKLDKMDILREAKLKELGLGQLNQAEKVQKEMDKAVKKIDIDDSNPPVEYSKNIYDNEELRTLKNRKPVKDLNIPRGHEIKK